MNDTKNPDAEQIKAIGEKIKHFCQQEAHAPTLEEWEYLNWAADILLKTEKQNDAQNEPQ